MNKIYEFNVKRIIGFWISKTLPGTIAIARFLLQEDTPIHHGSRIGIANEDMSIDEYTIRDYKKGLDTIKVIGSSIGSQNMDGNFVFVSKSQFEDIKNYKIIEKYYSKTLQKWLVR